VEAVVFNVPAVPTISPLWNTLTSSAPSGNQWYLNGGAIPGATGQTYIAGQAGIYTVVVTDANGCSSVSQPVFTTGVEELLNKNGFAVYPNPVSEVLTVEFRNTNAEDAVVRLYNLVGEVVLMKKVSAEKTTLELSGLSAGVYYAEVQIAGSVYRTKVIKQ
jgi:hypothetical protein